MAHLLDQIYQLLTTGHPLVLATVIRHSGSTPRGAGAKMIIRKDGSILGTIGGGSVEAAVIRSAVELFESGSALIRSFNFNSTDVASSMGMICGGEMTVLLERLDPDDSDTLDIFDQLLSRLRSYEKSLLVKVLSAHSIQPEGSPYCFVADVDRLPENLPVNPKKLEDLVKTAFTERKLTVDTSGDRMLLVDPFFSSDSVYLFGAGHVSQKLAGVLGMVDFRTVVIDDRIEFANRALFPATDEIVVPESFATAFSNLSISRRDALVILTRGHAHDQTVLEQALKTDAGYIGMIGSRKKRDTIYDNLEKKGVSRETLLQVHCPIGIDIGARTPEEIAVCIAAQLIAYRADRV